MVYQIEKMLRENGDKITGAERGEVENALGDAKKALEGSDVKQMNTAREKLTVASHKLAEAMYKQATPGAGAPGAGAGSQPGGNGHATSDEPKKDEGVIDAEYVEDRNS